METAAKVYPLLADMAENGNPASISDVGVAALAVRACIEGAAMNVQINLGQLKDEKVRSDLLRKVEKLREDSEAQFNRVQKSVARKLP